MPHLGELAALVYEMTKVVSYAKRYDTVSSTLAYFGEALPGSAESAAVWRVQEITIDPSGDVTTKWADGNAAFGKIWDDRASFTYS